MFVVHREHIVRILIMIKSHGICHGGCGRYDSMTNTQRNMRTNDIEAKGLIWIELEGPRIPTHIDTFNIFASIFDETIATQNIDLKSDRLGVDVANIARFKRNTEFSYLNVRSFTARSILESMRKIF